MRQSSGWRTTGSHPMSSRHREAVDQRFELTSGGTTLAHCTLREWVCSDRGGKLSRFGRSDKAEILVDRTKERGLSFGMCVTVDPAVPVHTRGEPVDRIAEGDAPVLSPVTKATA